MVSRGKSAAYLHVHCSSLELDAKNYWHQIIPSRNWKQPTWFSMCHHHNVPLGITGPSELHGGERVEFASISSMHFSVLGFAKTETEEYMTLSWLIYTALNIDTQESTKETKNSHLDDMSKVFPRDSIIRLDENLTQDRLAYGVVFGIKLVKAMEGVTILFKTKRQS